MTVCQRFTATALRRAAGLATAVALGPLAGCGVTPGITWPSGAPGAPPPAQTPAPPPPAAPAAPALSPAEAHAQSARLSEEALNLLQNGDEPTARLALDQALALDPANEVARKLVDQIRADARQELGAASYPYVVQPGDTLAKIAAAHLGDRYRFYILAKYNGITNPSRLLVGQTIRIPGVAPARAPAPVAVPAPAPAPKAAPEPAPVAVEPAVPARRREAERLLAEGQGLQKSGKLEAAYDSYVAAARSDPSFEAAVQRRDAARQELIVRHQRDASAAFQRQDLDRAIAKWDQVLALDPDNEQARLRKSQALDLKRRLEKLGSKPQ